MMDEILSVEFTPTSTAASKSVSYLTEADKMWDHLLDHLHNFGMPYLVVQCYYVIYMSSFFSSCTNGIAEH